MFPSLHLKLYPTNRSVWITQPIVLISPTTGAVFVNAEGNVLTRGTRRVKPLFYTDLYVLNESDEYVPLYALNNSDEPTQLQVSK